MKKIPWTEQEDNILRLNYEDKGIEYCYKLFEGRRTRDAIFKRVSKLQIKVKQNKNAWTVDEDNILKTFYSKKGPSFCYSKLEGKRTIQAITARASILGLQYKECGEPWSEDEDNFLKTFYPYQGLDFCYEKLGHRRTQMAITGRVAKLGLCSSNSLQSGSVWSEEEDNILKSFYSSKGLDFCYEKLNKKRTKVAIQNRASFLDLKLANSSRVNALWSKKEDEILRSYYSNQGVDYCFKLLGGKRTNESIKSRASKLGLNLSHHAHVYGTSWTKEEEDILKSYFIEKGVEYCYEKLQGKRTREAIRVRARNLHLDYENWTADEDDILRKFFITKGKYYCCKLLKGKRSLEAINWRVYKIGVLEKEY